MRLYSSNSCEALIMKKMNVKITDHFWSRYRDLVKTEMIPYQWRVLNDAIGIRIERERNDDTIPNEKSHAIENFKIAAGLADGQHYGWVFQDSDVYKWLEAVAYSLRDKPDAHLQKLADGVVDLIAKAQEDDGYLDTYFTIMEPDRKFKRLGESHELYCAGHYMEAAVAYYGTTGNTTAITVARKLADCIDAHFGSGEGKICGCDGHEEIEIGLMRLYHLTGEKRYLDLAQFFILERGKNPDFFRQQNEADHGAVLLPGVDRFPDTYCQNHKPVKEQTTAEGHAVRLVYMCTAMVDIAKTTGDDELLQACRTIWHNIVYRRMYVTGGIGSTVIGESFTLDYDLPNNTMYCETCAAIGLVFFAKKMLEADPRGEYADVMERALYNAVISGMALDGKHFFYVNPLEVDPKKSKKDPTKSHVKPVRPQWLGCACCPPNLARMVTSVEDYIYTVTGDTVYTHLYIQSETDAAGLRISQITDYPYDGNVKLHIQRGGSEIRRIAVRLPDWSDATSIKVDGIRIDVQNTGGYAYIELDRDDLWIELDFDMSVQRVYANLNVSENIGKVAVRRGPLVYCAEETDNGAGLHRLYLSKEAAAGTAWTEELSGVTKISIPGVRLTQNEEKLYVTGTPHVTCEKTMIQLIPYYAWANRGENEMRVWLNE